MKKTLLALATLGAMAGSAVAADVTLYGLVDYGFSYKHVDETVNDAEDTFQMKSGMNSGSRFGLKGAEDLGNGLKVGFVLENGFDADDGSFDSNGDNKIFGREAQMYVQGGFGTLSFGRVGMLASANGSYGLLGMVSPFSSGWGDQTGVKFVTGGLWGRVDNTITYVSPDFAGFKLHAQYSFKMNADEKDIDGNAYDEGSAKVSKYYALGATYSNGPLNLVLLGDVYDWGNVQLTNKNRTWCPDVGNGYTATFGGNYDFGVLKLYADVNYFRHVRVQDSLKGVHFEYIGNNNDHTYMTDGWGGAIGVAIPMFGGNLKGSVGYRENECIMNPDNDVERWSASIGYDYNLSKRTSVYTAATYVKDDFGSMKAGYEEYVDDPKTIEVMAGIIHKF